jgi:hypothetical protein
MSKIAKGNFAVAYHAHDLAGYVDQYSLKATVAAVDSTDMGAATGEAIPGIPLWVLRLAGDWAPGLDDILGPDALSPPAILRTLTVTLQTVTYQWVSPSEEYGAFVGEYETFADHTRQKQRWRGVILCAGAPGRSTT